MLVIIAIASAIANTGWRVVMNNFAVDTVGMTGADVGLLQSVREIPGLLSFTVLFLLLIISEQQVAVLSVTALGLGVAITGYLPSIYGFYFSTTLMSVGFHYLEAVNKSLSTQLLGTENFSESMGRIRAAASFFSMVTFICIIIANYVFGVSDKAIFFASGTACFWLAFYLLTFKNASCDERQHTKLIVRREYTTYYILTFLSGARRQIFVVFAGLLMVTKFHYTIAMMAALFMLSSLSATVALPVVGRFIDRVGEKRSLLIEYAALMLVFLSYAFVDNHYLAGGLYVVDSIIFSFAIALTTYFKKTVRSNEVASTASLSFTINHIAAVFLPFLLGVVWMSGYQWVFVTGAIITLLSFLISLTIDTRLHQRINGVTELQKEVV
ncbi:MFS transporter [Vibrio splendidus]|uniref:MFS transporter n=1 Tax=Vibrio splendidus TaxID=29497 RepID=UPI000D33757E|nr:MFS transporter [Vibrio splendidus]PTP02387.1 MFS transporter [Vibrio splendidus]PTP19809.1 MFS transporter [Vibrio splendidus]